MAEKEINITGWGIGRGKYSNIGILRGNQLYHRYFTRPYWDHVGYTKLSK